MTVEFQLIFAIDTNTIKITSSIRLLQQPLMASLR